MKQSNNLFTDPILQGLIEKYPPPFFKDRSTFLYEDLIESIVSQQLSIKAADTIFGRFKELFKTRRVARLGDPQQLPASDQVSEDIDGGEERQDPYVFPTPQQILNKSDDQLRAVGLSYQKASYIKSVATVFDNNEISSKLITEMPDEEVITELTKIKGVGKWTAEMILIFTLNRPDIFSVGDLGIRNAITRLYGITDQQEMVKLAESWKPNRSTACWYLWRSLENKS